MKDEFTALFEDMGCSVNPMFQSISAVGYGGLTIVVAFASGPQDAEERRFRDTWKGGLRLVDCREAVVETVDLLKRWEGLL